MRPALVGGQNAGRGVQLTRLGCRGVEEVGLVALLLYEIGAAPSLYLGINANWLNRPLNVTRIVANIAKLPDWLRR